MRKQIRYYDAKSLAERIREIRHMREHLELREHELSILFEGVNGTNKLISEAGHMVQGLFKYRKKVEKKSKSRAIFYRGILAKVKVGE